MARSEIVTRTFEAADLFQVLNARRIEKQIAREDGVHDARASYAARSVTVTYDESTISASQLADRIRACGLHCRGEVVPQHVCTPQTRDAPETQASRGQPREAHPREGAHEASAAHEMGHGAGMDPGATMRIDVARFVAFVVDLDGVVTDTDAIHAAAWKRLFDEVLARHGGAPFDVIRDYRAYVDGKSRRDGLRSFLDARGISVPAGTPRDGEQVETLHGLAARKNRYFLEHLRAGGVRAYPDAVSLLREARTLGVRIAMATASENGAAVVAAARLGDLFDAQFDGRDLARLRLPGKPAPDMFLAAAGLLRVEPHRAVLFEDSIAGVQAGRAGELGIVIGVARAGQAAALRDNGADEVVATLDDVELVRGAREEAR